MTEAIRLALLGDTALGGSLSHIDVAQAQRRSAQMAELLAGTDLRFLSFDCAIGQQGDPVFEDEYVIDCPVEMLELLESWEIDVVSLANNHSTDRGLQSLLAGIQRLRGLGMDVVGAGTCLREAEGPVFRQCGDLRVGVLAFASSHPWVGAYPATQTRGGVAPLCEDRVLAAVEAARSQADALIVSLHWGKEYIPVPPPANVHFARQLIDAGVRVVVGHHPHIIQPVESYKGGVICYSLGNFFFPDYPAQGLRFSGEASESLLVTVTIDRERASIHQITPVSCDGNGHVGPVTESRKDQILSRQSVLVEGLGEERGDKAWSRAVRQYEVARLRRVLRQEVLDAGFRDGTSRLLRLGRKNLRSLGRSLGEIIGGGQR